jgi:VWFA-related protein
MKHTLSLFRRHWPYLCASGAIAMAAAVVAAMPVHAQQAPVFRSSVDLIAVDVQVVDRNGNPIEQLAPDTFDVSINGRRRKVVSAEFIRQAPKDSTTLSRLAEANPTIVPTVSDTEQGRLFIVAIDNGSFDPGTVQPTLEAIDHFIQHLEPADRVGLYVYPNGPKLDPTTQRAQLRASLRQVTGERVPPQSRYSLRASEIVDITAALASGIRARTDLNGNAFLNSPDPTVSTLADVARRECPEDPDCAQSVLNDVAAIAPRLEEQAESSLGGLDALLRGLTALPGRKSVLLISAGVLVSDRSDGRPDVGDVSRIMGQSAALANATVYTVQVQPPPSTGMSAQSRRASVIDGNRDRQLLGNWLDNFSAAAGGMRQYVPVGAGDYAFDRVLRETSAHYLLGVEPEQSDRDGRPRELKVKVGQRGVTVHSRQWVVVPVAKNES